MRQSMIVALSTYNQEVEGYVQDELQKALDTFDYEGTVKDIARDIIKETITRAITNYFGYGEGYKLIEQLVAENIFTKEAKE
jgi:hypothetical protein